MLKRLLAKLPTPLPQGMTEFNAWADSIIEMAGLPNNDSMKFALATQVLHLKPDASSIPKDHFIKLMKKSAANQIAAGIMQELKDKQQQMQLEQQRQAAEAAAAQTSESSSSPSSAASAPSDTDGTNGEGQQQKS